MAFLNEDLLPQDSYSDPYPPDGGGMDSTTSQPDNTGTGDDGSGSNKGSWRDYQVTPPNTVNPPPAPPPSTGFYNPVIDTSGVLNTIPALNSVFKNPLNTGGFSAPSPMSLNMGGGIQLPSLANNFSNPVTDRTPALVNPALQGNFKNAFERISKLIADINKGSNDNKNINDIYNVGFQKGSGNNTNDGKNNGNSRKPYQPIPIPNNPVTNADGITKGTGNNIDFSNPNDRKRYIIQPYDYDPPKIEDNKQNKSFEQAIRDIMNKPIGTKIKGDEISKTNGKLNLAGTAIKEIERIGDGISVIFTDIGVIVINNTIEVVKVPKKAEFKINEIQLIKDKTIVLHLVSTKAKFLYEDDNKKWYWSDFDILIKGNDYSRYGTKWFPIKKDK